MSRLYPKLKMSYSLYSMMARKNIDWFKVKMYLDGKEGYRNKWLDNGKLKHQLLEFRDIDPKIIDKFGNGKYLREHRFYKDLNDTVVFTGIIDLYRPGDKGLIIDYKSGKNLPNKSDQLSLYNWALGKNNETYLIHVDNDLNIGQIKEIKYTDKNWEEILLRQAELIFENIF